MAYAVAFAVPCALLWMAADVSSTVLNHGNSFERMAGVRKYSAQDVEKIMSRNKTDR